MLGAKLDELFVAFYAIRGFCVSVFQSSSLVFILAARQRHLHVPLHVHATLAAHNVRATVLGPETFSTRRQPPIPRSLSTPVTGGSLAYRRVCLPRN